MPTRSVGVGWIVVALLAGAVAALALLDGILRFSPAPEWIQAGAAILSLLTTGVLAYLTWRYVQFTRDIATATRQQVEGVVAAGRSRQRIVAATLLEDVRRISGELGARAADGEVAPIHTANEIVPRVHRWLEPLIPQIAETDPAVVGLFLQLDRDLQNYAAGCEVVRQAQEDLGLKEQTLGTFTKTYQSTAATMAEVTPWAEAQREVRLADDKLRQILDATTVAYNRCHGTLDEITQALKLVLKTASPESGTLPAVTE